MQRLFSRSLRFIRPKHFDNLPNEERIVEAIWLLNAYFTFIMVGIYVGIYSFVLTLPLIPYLLLTFCFFGQGLVIKKYYAHGLCSQLIHISNTIVLMSILHGLVTSGATLTPGFGWVIPPTIISAFTLKDRSYFFWPALYLGIFAYGHFFAPPATQELIDIFNKHAIMHKAGILFVVTMQVWGIAKIHTSQVNDLNLLRADLKKRLEQNRNLVRILSHDLANPLMVAGISTSSLKASETDDKRLVKIERAERAIEQMKEIINRVRGLLALADGKTGIDLAQTDLNHILQKSVDSFQEKLEQKKLQVVIAGQANPAYADPFILGNQVINNLLSNAIKFSYPNSIIQFNLFSDPQTGLEKLSIRDRGDGIPKDLLNILFSVDHKTSRQGTNGESGTGFGMPIVKSAVELMKGSISVHSKTRDEHGDECGTEFIIALPSYRASVLNKISEDAA